MTPLVRRLAQLSSDELLFRVREAASTVLERARYSSGLVNASRHGLARELSGRTAAISHARRALERGDWTSANAALRQHFLERPSRFVIAPANRAGLVSAVLSRFPAARTDAVARADRVLHGEYDLLGYRSLSFRAADGDIDWHFDPVHQSRAPVRFWSRVAYLDPRYGDHKVIWELNRHQHWLALGRAAWLDGDVRFARQFTAELDSWLRANPPLTGINWTSMLELAFRSLSWIWALHLFAPVGEDDGAGWLVALLQGLRQQLDHVARHLSRYFSPNTHLLGEGLALYVAGRVLPELAQAPNWERLGRDVLIREAGAQVHADGGHAERSTHYHRYALDFYLLALTVARRTGDEAAHAFEGVTARLAEFCRHMTDDNGWLPAIGDDDGGMLFPVCGRTPADVRDSLSLASILLDRPALAVSDPPEETLWMLDGVLPAPPPSSPTDPDSRLFPDTGYAVLRAGSSHAVVDAGPHGFLNGGHAHADALSVVVSVGGRPFAIDPGTATYTMDREVRDRFRSTAMHNTLVLDGRPQSIPAGPFHWRSLADATVLHWASGGNFAHVEAEHDGYLPLVHRRAVTMAAGDLCLVIDHVLGQGQHTADVYWHLAADWSRNPGQPGVFMHSEGLRVDLACTAGAPQELLGDPGGLGWHAPVYGRVLPSPTLRFTARDRAPFSMATAIITDPAGRSRAPSSHSPGGNLQVPPPAIVPGPALVDEDDGWHRLAVEVIHGDARTVAVHATTVATPHRGARVRGVQRIAVETGVLATDARLAVLCLSAIGEPLALHLLDATHAVWSGRYSLEIPQHATARDLHFDQDALRRLSRSAEARPVG